MRFDNVGNVALLLGVLMVGSAFASVASLSAGAASKLVAKQIDKDGRYQGRLPFKCMRFAVKDTTPRYIDLALAVKLGEGCEAAVAAAMSADQFRVNRQTQEIFLLDRKSGNYLPYSGAMPVQAK